MLKTSSRPVVFLNGVRPVSRLALRFTPNFRSWLPFVQEMSSTSWACETLRPWGEQYKVPPILFNADPSKKDIRACQGEPPTAAQKRGAWNTALQEKAPTISRLIKRA